MRYVLALLLTLASCAVAEAGIVRHVVKPIAVGVYGLGKGVGTAGANVTKTAAYPATHPRKTAHAAVKVAHAVKKVVD
jgi:hypothetical protein